MRLLWEKIQQTVYSTAAQDLDLANNNSDILSRHRRLNCSTVARNSLKHPQSRTRTACENCAKLKLRCSEPNPCGKCQRKNIPCVRRSREWTIDPTEADNATPENPLGTQFDPGRKPGNQQETPDNTTPEVSVYKPQILGIAGTDFEARRESRPADYGREWRH